MVQHNHWLCIGANRATEYRQLFGSIVPQAHIVKIVIEDCSDVEVPLCHW